MKLGINGFGRIGKLSTWDHIGRKFFGEIVINIGRNSGNSFEDILHYLENDSTYGSIHKYLYGHTAEPIIDEINIKKKEAIVNGIPLKFLTKSRNPSEINWKKERVEIVLDTTGKFLDPTLKAEYPGGSLKGHFKSGAKKVIVSAPFNLNKSKNSKMPRDAITTVMGINDSRYQPKIHNIISNASCTTTCLAHMIKPLLKAFGAKRILSASMAAIHAVTGSQEVLDRLPKANKSDLRKNRSIFNNIILTSTGAAKALNLVIPEMEKIGFIAESVRVPISSGSLIILVLNVQESTYNKSINRNVINNIYKNEASLDLDRYLQYTDKQNVSGDILNISKAGAIIEGHETHTRTAEINLNLSNILKNNKLIIKKNNVRVPITQAVIYGWYDNEMSGYVKLLGDRIISIAKEM